VPRNSRHVSRNKRDGESLCRPPPGYLDFLAVFTRLHLIRYSWLCGVFLCRCGGDAMVVEGVDEFVVRLLTAGWPSPFACPQESPIYEIIKSSLDLRRKCVLAEGV